MRSRWRAATPRRLLATGPVVGGLTRVVLVFIFKNVIFEGWSLPECGGAVRRS
ncbi:hypothetical protein [Halosolutus gelatinilyticus]|uniref:hypothetical protein n=1 Tax=Halosolutus gelatinilyticus TaxID=2931975 RepID=UPI001FF2274E|nr:hypothetical protein [Halosolutus gelatinilyticus]